jgi:hypothetical protein
MSVVGQLGKLTFKTADGRLVKLLASKQGQRFIDEQGNTIESSALDKVSTLAMDEIRKGNIKRAEEILASQRVLSRDFDTPIIEITPPETTPEGAVDSVVQLGVEPPKRGAEPEQSITPAKLGTESEQSTEPPKLADGLTPNQQLQHAVRQDIAAQDGKQLATERVINMLDDQGIMPEDTRSMLRDSSMRDKHEWANDPSVKAIAGIGLAGAAATQSDDAKASAAPEAIQLEVPVQGKDSKAEAEIIKPEVVQLDSNAQGKDQEDPDTKMADLVANMVQSGEMSMDEAYSVLQTNAPDIADKVLAPALQAHKQSLRAQGMNPWSVAKEMETKYNQPMNIQQMFTPDMPPEAIIQAIEKVNEQPWAQAKEIGSLVSDEARVAIKEHAHQLASVIAAGLQDRGFEVRATDDGEGGVLVEYKDKNTGQWKVADANSSRDFSGAGALAGAGAGALTGGAVAGPVGALGGAALGAGAGYLAGGSVDPLAASAFQVGGGLAAGSAAFRAAGALVPPAGLPGIAAKAGLTAIGTGLGAMAGSTVDHLAAAAILKQQLDTKELLARAAEDGTTDAVLGLGVDTVLRGGAKMYQGIKKAITTARNAVDSYMLQGALKELENITGLTKAERLTLADKLEEVSQDAIARSEARREIEGVLQTRPGMEILVGEASRLSKTAGFGMLKEIDRRAKDVLNTADKMTADNISRVLVNELDSYKTAVKKSYEGIKMLGAREADSVGFQYNPNELGLPKLRNDMEGALANPSQISRFDSLWAKLEDIGAIRDEKGAIVDYVKNYGLAELLDTRRILTSFKSGNLDFGTIDKVNRVIANIDKEIDEAVKVMPNGEQWAEQFGQAKVEYSKMKALEENVMYKALTKEGISADDVVKTLSKYIKAEDGTFMKVLGKLPPAVRNNVEGAVIRNYANRYTVGDDQGFQAIDFPALARELDGVNFTTPGARDLKRVVDKLAKVYKNDPALAREAGALQMPKDKTYLATSMAGRIDMALHTELFNYISRYLPTQRGRTRRLAEAISTVLDNPLNAKAVDHLTNELPKDPEMRTKLHQLAISYAERGQKETYPKVPLYKVYQNGYSQSTKATKYGEGIQYYTSKEAADAARTAGQRVEEVLVEPSRYATLEQASVVVGKKLTPAMLKQPRVVQQLKDLGYLGIADKDLVFEFK